MTWLSAGKNSIAGLLLLMGGCLEIGSASLRYPEQITTDFISNTVTVDIGVHKETGEYLPTSGRRYRDFIDNLSRTSPQHIILTPRHETIDVSGLRAELWVLALAQGGQVITNPPDASLTAGTDIRIEIVYFLYRLLPCGADLARRKLDQPGMTTSGFGCAVTRNLKLSIADPGKNGSGEASGVDPSTAGNLRK